MMNIRRNEVKYYIVTWKGWKIIGAGYWYIFHAGIRCGRTTSLREALEVIGCVRYQ